ncbi:MAG: hypothetical protein R2882_06540 [Gemmatimonadales bacterium]
MMQPLPFRLAVPGIDDVEGLGARSVSIKVEGLAHWDGEQLTLEWVETHHIDEVSIERVRSEVVAQPSLILDVPMDVLASAGLLGGWWRPRVELRARYLSAFANVPGAKPGRLDLRIGYRHRPVARELVALVNAAIAGAPELPPASDLGALEPITTDPAIGG